MATSVGIRELRDGLADDSAAAEPVEVTRHGVTVGWFIPTPMDRIVQVASLRSAVSALEVVLSDRGVDVDDLVAELAAARPAR